MFPPARLRPLRWPTQCGVCQDWGWSRICAPCVTACTSRLARCSRCALNLPASLSLCGECLRHPPPWDTAVAAVDYASPWDRLIGRFKFHAGLDLADALVDQMLAALARAGQPDPGLLLPAPLSAERLRERGYNQSWELARRLARRLKAPADAALLLRVRHAPAQMGVPLGDRAANVEQAFAIEPRRRAELQGRHVTLVDDVLTTGATAGEISRVLRAAGAARVQVWTLARTPAPGD